MSIVITIIAFVLIFSLLILIHELGHFVMAKRAGIKVEEFGFGLPPRLWGKKKGETIYSINWIPFGGFVRMLGEDSLDPKMLRSKRSFVAQPMRARVKVIVAGVVMNFLLAWFLLAIGFSFGMEPLLGPDDVLGAVNDGVIELQGGVKIKSVEEGSLADELGFKAEDLLFSIDDQSINVDSVQSLILDPVGSYKVVRAGDVYSYEIIAENVENYNFEDGIGLELYDFVPFPRVKVFDSMMAGLQPDDVVLSVNDEQVFYVSQFEELVRGQSILDYEVYRDGQVEKVIVDLPEAGRKVVISRVLLNGPAYTIGLQEGDVIISINGREINDSQEMIDFVGSRQDEALAYLIERDHEKIFYEIEPEDGKIGVLLSELIVEGMGVGVSIYNVDLISTVLGIKDEQYPVHVAVYKSFGESVRLAKLTAGMFLDFISSVVGDGEIPDSVAGPVGIAQLTHVFVQEGLIPLLRFVAILSLSLAVINILPFPALDGGRLLFIVIELIIGRRVNQKWESFIHAIGYGLILLLILAVTYSDIIRLVGG